MLMQYVVQQTEISFDWRDTLPDTKTKVTIARRIERLRAGLLGDDIRRAREMAKEV